MNWTTLKVPASSANLGPGFDVLANTLRSWGIRPNCAISSVPPACAKGPTGASGTTGSTGSTGATGSH